MRWVGFISVCAVLLSGCQALDRKQNLARVQPLFSDEKGAALDVCLNDPTTLLAVTAPRAVPPADAVGTLAKTDCVKLANLIRAYGFQDIGAMAPIPAPGQPAPTKATAASPVTENEWKRRRNEVVDALIAVSNEKCGNYSAHLKTFDGTTNSALSILAILTGGVGGILTPGDASRALSGSSAMISGSRVALNDSWFSNQTIHVLVAAFEKARQLQRGDIKNRQACPITTYTLNQGLGDAMRYHASCSLLTGLAETALAVARTDQPGLETMRRQLADLQAIRAQANYFVNASLPVESVETRVALQDRNDAQRRMLDAERDRNKAKDAIEEVKVSIRASAAPPADEAGVDAAVPGALKNALRSAEEILAEAITAATSKDAALRTAIAKDQAVADARATTLATLTKSAKDTAICPYGGEAPIGPDTDKPSDDKKTTQGDSKGQDNPKNSAPAKTSKRAKK